MQNANAIIYTLAVKQRLQIAVYTTLPMFVQGKVNSICFVRTFKRSPKLLHFGEV